jgi:hypothetical protein
MEIDHTPIRIPAEDWDHEKDQEYADWVGVDPDRDAVESRAHEELELLAYLLEEATSLFPEYSPDTNESDLGRLAADFKSYLKAAHPQIYEECLAEGLNDIKFVWGEFQRVVAAYTAQPDLEYLQPWIDCGDLVLCAARPFLNAVNEAEIELAQTNRRNRGLRMGIPQ